MASKRASRSRALPPAVSALVQTLRRHLLGGGFRVGERYLSVRQAARRFAVSPVTAHQAMAALEEQGLLQLRRGSGAYVAQPVAGTGQRRVVQVFLRDDPDLRQRFLLDGLQLGLIETLPREVVIQLHFVPPGDATGYLVQAWEGRQWGDGVVLLRVGREARRFFHQRGVATVALGTAEDDLNIASVGHDQTALGEAAAALLVSHRRREAVLAMQQEWDLGDNQMVDALQRRLDAASPRVRLRVASVPGDAELAAGVLTAALASQGPSPTLLCRSGQMALRAAQIAARQRLRPAQTMLVALGSDGVGRQAPAMPIHAPNVDDREVGQAAANLLTAQWNAGRPLRQRVNLLHHLHLIGT
jgi:hypothetical protein